MQQAVGDAGGGLKRENEAKAPLGCMRLSRRQYRGGQSFVPHQVQGQTGRRARKADCKRNGSKGVGEAGGE